jgi:7-cyano-7-deazaguanine reductase
MVEDRYSGLQQLGSATEQPASPETAVLERVAAETGGKNVCVRFTCPEFTSLCPMTGQPDFAHIVIDYIPDQWLVESKSLKLFMNSFRNVGGFHEACTLMIADRLIELMAPKWLRIGAYWYPRGGIPIDVFWQTGVPPEDAWIPSQDVPGYRGRG